MEPCVACVWFPCRHMGPLPNKGLPGEPNPFTLCLNKCVAVYHGRTSQLPMYLDRGPCKFMSLANKANNGESSLDNCGESRKHIALPTHYWLTQKALRKTNTRRAHRTRSGWSSSTLRNGRSKTHNHTKLQICQQHTSRLEVGSPLQVAYSLSDKLWASRGL